MNTFYKEEDHNIDECSLKLIIDFYDNQLDQKDEKISMLQESVEEFEAQLSILRIDRDILKAKIHDTQAMNRMVIKSLDSDESDVYVDHHSLCQLMELTLSDFNEPNQFKTSSPIRKPRKFSAYYELRSQNRKQNMTQ